VNTGEQWSRGDRCRLTGIDKTYSRLGLALGMTATVMRTDALGTVHLAFDNGVRTGIPAELGHYLQPVVDDEPAP